MPDLKSKSSKVETLRGAIDYIRRLKELLGEDVADLCTPVPKIELEDDDGKHKQRDTDIIQFFIFKIFHLERT